MASADDFEYWVRNNNPFAKNTTFQYSPDTQVAQNWGDALNAIDWENNQRKSRSNLMAGGLNFSPGSPFSAGSGSPTPKPTATGNPFSLVKLSKDPSGRFDWINNQATDAIAGFKPNYSNYRSTIGNFNNANSQNFNADEGEVRSGTNALIENYNKNKGALDAQTEQQVNYLNRNYLDDTDPNSISWQLHGQDKAGYLAEIRQGNRAAQQADLRSRMRGVGTGSSYANAENASIGSQLRDQAQVRLADRTRDTSRYALGLKQQNIGRPQELEVANILRSNIPIEARNALIRSEAANIGDRLRNTGQAVNLDQLTDSFTTEGRRLGLSGQALSQYLAANFLDVEKDGEAYPLNIAGGGGRRFNPPANPGRDPYNQDPYRRPSRDNTTPGTTPFGTSPTPARGRSAAEEKYREFTGQYPDQDPLFDPNIWNDILDQKISNQRNGWAPGETPPWNQPDNPFDPSEYDYPRGNQVEDYGGGYDDWA